MFFVYFRNIVLLLFFQPYVLELLQASCIIKFARKNSLVFRTVVHVVLENQSFEKVTVSQGCGNFKMQRLQRFLKILKYKNPFMKRTFRLSDLLF